MTYTQETIAEKNITLSFEFERYLLENPELLMQIPDGAEVILLPKDDPELYQANLETAHNRQTTEDSLDVIYVEIESLAPQRSRLVDPHLTTEPSFIS